MKQAFYWIEHLFWEIGWAFIALLKGNVSGAAEMFFWIKIHLTYSGKCSCEKTSFLAEVKVKCIAIVGLLVVLGVLLLLSFAGYIITYVILINI
jgi:hypothetical protein